MSIKYSESDVDQLAARLHNMAQLAGAMPPSFMGGNISIPICSPAGQYAGRALPGTGIYLPFDLKDFGITKPIPGVYTYSPTQRRLDVARSYPPWQADLDREHDERRAIALLEGKLDVTKTRHGFRPIGGGTITTYDGIIAARAGGKAQDFMSVKNSITTVANIWYSLWQAAGNPQAGAYTNIPTGATMTNATAGAWSQGLTNPTGGDKHYILTFGFTAGQSINLLMLVDQLVAAGNISTNSNVNQTVSTAALTRYTSGIGVNMIFDVVTAPASGSQNLTVNSYTNTTPTGGRTTAAHQFSSAEVIPIMRLQPKLPTANASVPMMQLAAGDIGVTAVSTVVFSSAVTTGVVAIILYFPLAFIPGIAGNVYIERDSTVQIDGLTELAQTSGAVLGCLNVFVNVFTTSTGPFVSFTRTVQG